MGRRDGTARAATLLDKVDPVWARIRDEAEEIVRARAGACDLHLFDHPASRHAGSRRSSIASPQRLDHDDVSGELIRQAYADALESDPSIGRGLPRRHRRDLRPRSRPPTASSSRCSTSRASTPSRRIGWRTGSGAKGRKDFAYYLQSRSSAVFQSDIHPAAPIGRGIFLDHATGLVVGETAVIEDDVSMLQGVTLGGTGKEDGDRHPKIRHGVLIGAGAKILGNIEVGHCARIAAGSVVLKPVPHNITVAGVPARVVGEAGCAEPSRSMDHGVRQTEID